MGTRKEHDYTCQIAWTGNRGEGTKHYRGYDRSWDIVTPGKPVIHCSNDPLLGGDPTRPNPEDLLLATLSACHMLWYLHLASNAGIVVHAYADQPVAVGETAANGSGRFLRATLKPRIEVAAGARVDLEWDVSTSAAGRRNGSIYLLSSCDVNECLVGSDTSEPEAITYTNTSGSTETLYVGLDSKEAVNSPTKEHRRADQFWPSSD